MTRLWRHAAVVLLLAVVMAVNIRVVVSADSDLLTARQCIDAGLIDTGIDFYVRAARWYSPFSSTSSEAIDGLLNIGKGSGVPVTDKTAMKALSGARSAILATRWLMTPHRDQLTEINSLLADSAAASGRVDRDKTLTELENTSMPNPFLSLAATLFFVVWIIVTLAAAFKSVTPDGRFAGRPALRWMAVSGVLLACWLLLLAVV